MRLKNLAWAFLFLPNVAGTPYRVPRPAAPAAVLSHPLIPPPVCIGEVHTQAEHTRIERETILALSRRGYTTVDIEFPRDLQQPLETYLHSQRGPAEARVFFAALVDAATPPARKKLLTPGMRDRVIDQVERRPELRRALALMGSAADAGMTLHFIDIPAAAIDVDTDNVPAMLENLKFRNEAMAQMLGEDAARSGTLSINGDLHESTTVVPNSLPEALLKNRGIACQVFELAVNGQRPEIASGIAPGKLQPAGRLVSSSREILDALDADFRLSTPLPVSPIHDTIAAR